MIEAGYQRLVHIRDLREPCVHDALVLCALREMLPELFGDEGHERMQQTEKRVEETECRLNVTTVDRSAVSGLYHLEVPA